MAIRDRVAVAYCQSLIVVRLGFLRQPDREREWPMKGKTCTCSEKCNAGLPGIVANKRRLAYLRSRKRWASGPVMT